MKYISYKSLCIIRAIVSHFTSKSSKRAVADPSHGRSLPAFVILHLVLAGVVAGVQADAPDEWNKIDSALEGMGFSPGVIAGIKQEIQENPEKAKDWLRNEQALPGSGGRYEVQGWVVNDPVQQYDTLAAYDYALQKDPENAKAWFNKANALARLGRYEYALKAIDTAIQIDPGYVHAWNKKGITLRKMGRIKESDAAFDKAKALRS
jgi:tetratricopeptide (TPR) repeat protein